MYAYDTVTAAIDGLKGRGYTLDFSLEENCLICAGHKLNAEDFEVTEVHRFEGNSDPADEAVVYGIEGKNNAKGYLVTGYGISAEGTAADIIRKLQMHTN